MPDAPVGIAAASRAAPSRLPKPGWTLVLASLGLFMSALDNMVVTTALPVLRVSLHASLASLEWTVNAYLLSFACMLLTGAALGDRFGRLRMFRVGVAVFTAASAWAALAPTVDVLIAARVAQGVGAAIIMPLSLTLVSEAFPAGKRAAAIGLWGGIAGLAAAGGPVVGGAVVQGMNWHWIFWLNVPVGLAVIPLSAFQMRESFGPRPRLDIAGLVLAAAGCFGLVWALVRSGTVGWGSGEVIATLAVGAVLLGAFLWWERRTPRPMLSLTLFREPRFTRANGVSFFMYAGVFGPLFLMAQFLQIAQHYTPLQTGIRLLPWTAAAMLVSPAAGKLAGRYGNRPFMAGGLFLQTVALAWMAAIAAPDLGYWQLGAALTVAGTAIGLVIPTVSGEVVAAVPHAEIGVASGTNSALRQLGGVFGVAVLATVFSRPGVYGSPALFADGFRAALWAGAGFSAAGVLIAVSARRRTVPEPLGEPAGRPLQRHGR
jgi:EmrB/QacA subfamily drug resistance transporter